MTDCIAIKSDSANLEMGTKFHENNDLSLKGDEIS